MWQKIGEAVLRNRLALLLSVVAITGIMAYYAAQVKMSYDFGRAIPTDHPEYQTYLSFMCVSCAAFTGFIERH